MKEKLNYVYFNKQWKDWRRQFARAEEFKTVPDAEFDNSIDDVLQFIEHSERQRNRADLYSQLLRNNAIELALFDDIDSTLDLTTPDSPTPCLLDRRAGAVRRNSAMGRGEGLRHGLLRVGEGTTAS